MAHCTTQRLTLVTATSAAHNKSRTDPWLTKILNHPAVFFWAWGMTLPDTKQIGVVGEIVTNPIASGQQLTDFAFSQFKESSSFDTNLEISASVDASIGVFGIALAAPTRSDVG